MIARLLLFTVLSATAVPTFIKNVQFACTWKSVKKDDTPKKVLNSRYHQATSVLYF